MGLEKLKKVRAGIYRRLCRRPGRRYLCAEANHRSGVVQQDTADSSTIKAFFKWCHFCTGSQKVDQGQKEVTRQGDLPPSMCCRLAANAKAGKKEPKWPSLKKGQDVSQNQTNHIHIEELSGI